jgi:hypothetical protein
VLIFTIFINMQTFIIFLMGLDDKIEHFVRELGFDIIRDAPFRIGNVLFPGDILIKEGFVFDPSQLRVFVGGAAGEGYNPEEEGIRFEEGYNRARDLGWFLAQKGAAVVTGYTPKRSIPHGAAVGAHAAGGVVFGISARSDPGQDAERLQCYSLVYLLDIGSGNFNVDCLLRDDINGVSSHIMVAGPGMHGTWHETSVDRQLYHDRPLALIPGVGGIVYEMRKGYPHLNGGHPLLSDHRMNRLAAKIVRAARLIKSSVDECIPYFVDNLRNAGVPMLAQETPLARDYRA